jgi:hypothetical protein
VVASYSGGTDGAISGFLFVDELAATTSTTMDGPVFANTGNLTIGADGDGSGDAPVVINHVEYAGIALTEALAREKCRRWNNLLDKYGSRVTITYSAPAAFPLAPPDSGAEPFIVISAQNSNRAGKPGNNNGGLYGSSGLTNQLYRSQICKTSSGGHPDTGGWAVPTETAGDGTADVICDTARYAEGFESLRMDLTGTTSVAQQCSICYTTAAVIGARYNLDAWALPSVNSAPGLTLEEYDAADCTTLLATNTATRSRETSTWDKYNLNVAYSTWHADTSSYRICMTETCDGGCTTYWDAPMLRSTAAPTGTFAVPTDGFCGSDANAVASCSANYFAIENKLDYASPWEIAIDASTPSDGTDTLYTYILPKTGGTNENRLQATLNSPGRFTFYDGSSTTKTSDPDGYVFSSDTEVDFKFQRNMGASLRACADWTCDSSPATGATNTAYSTTAYLGGTSANYNVWTKKFRIKKRPTIISTGPGWNTYPDFFSIFQISDTQIYAESHPTDMSDMVDWIVANAAGHKLKMIMHTGDLVNTESVAQQWTDTDTYLTRFDTASLPWMVTAGNHDFCTPWSSCPSGAPTTYLSLYGSARFSALPYWGGTSANDLNHWTTITVLGQQYIFIMVELDQPAAAISWAEGIITANPGVPVIIGTHQYLRDDTQARSSVKVFRTGGQGGDALWAMAKTHDEVRMIMGGHFVAATGEGVQVSVNDAGHNVYEFIANYQERYNGGNGIVRMYRVYPAINLMQMRTYSSRKDTWDLDAESMRDFVWR